MSQRRRPIIIALVFLSSLALGGVGVAWLGRLFRLAGGGAGAIGLVFASALGGLAVGALGLTSVRRPALVWAAGLLGAAVGALPFSLATIGSPLTSLVAAAFGACVAAALVGATQSLAGLDDTPGQDLAQVLGVSALGAGVSIALAQAGMIASLGFDGLARGSGFFCAGLIALVVPLAHRPRVELADVTLGAPPVRVVGHGASAGAAIALWWAVLGWAWGAEEGNGALALAAIALVCGIVLAVVAARQHVDVELAHRRALAAAAFVFVLVAGLTPRLVSLGVFGNAIVRPVGFAWLVELAVRVALIGLASAPLVVLLGVAWATSARSAVQAPSNAGRWLSAQAFGAALGVWLVARFTSARSVEWLWGTVGAGLLVVTIWHWRGARALVPLALVGSLLHGWSGELLDAGAATEWKRRAPVPANRSVVSVAADLAEVVMVTAAEGRQALRVGGHVEATTGRPGERALLGLHAALLSGAGVARRALIVGVAPGAIEALRSHGVAEIELVAPPEVLDAAQALGVSLDGARVHRGEARSLLEQPDGEWDLIVFLPPRPGTASARGLFTLEAWRAAKRHLSPAGQLVQRLDTWAAGTSEVRATVRTLRILFPHGTTWGGTGEISMVMSDVEPVLAPPRLAARMEAPRVKEALEPLELASPAGLLAWQVHSPEGQVRFAGPGPASTDRRPLIELGLPVAAFLDETSELGDERLGAHSGLALARWADEVPLTSRDLEAIVRALSRHAALWNPVVRAAAEHWLALSPGSTEAAIAVVRSQLAQKDLASAIAVLDPRLRVDDPPPALVALALEVLEARIAREGAVVRRVDTGPLRELARLTLAKHPEHQGLRAALAAIEGLP